MFLKSNEICKLGSKCPYIGSGNEKCFGLKKDRNVPFHCYFVLDKEGNFRDFSRVKGKN